MKFIKCLLFSLLLGFGVKSFAFDQLGLFDLLSAKTTSFSHDCKTLGFKGKICDIYLSETIETPESYKDLHVLLNRANDSDVMVFHMAGNGGSGDGMIYIANAIQNTKAKTVAKIDGSVASAHATLSFTTNKTIIGNNDGYIYIHNISISDMENYYCNKVSGTDRGIALYEKCKEVLPQLSKIYNKVIVKYLDKYLTEEEKNYYKKGHDLIIDLQEFKKRLQ